MRKKAPLISADDIAGLANKGEDVSRFFTNRGSMMGPIRRVNVDFTSPMLAELDRAAEELNVSRQAVIKSLLRGALDQHYLAMQTPRAPKRKPVTLSSIHLRIETRLNRRLITTVDIRLGPTITSQESRPPPSVSINPYDAAFVARNSDQYVATVEKNNLSQNGIMLVPDVYICQLILERVSNEPASAPNQFVGQRTPAGGRYFYCAVIATAFAPTHS